MTERNIRAILFDLGDTLVEFGKIDMRQFFEIGSRNSYDYLVEKHYPVPPWSRYRRRFRFRIGMGLLRVKLTQREPDPVQWLQRFHRSIGVILDAEAALELSFRLFDPIRRAGIVPDGTLETLSTLTKSGYSLALISNTFAPGLVHDAQLAEADLLEWLPLRFYSCEMGYRKPHRRIFEAALRRMGVRPWQAVIVGDRMDTDIKGGRRAGLTTILKVPNGLRPRGRHQPHHVIRRLTELPALLSKSQP